MGDKNNISSIIKKHKTFLVGYFNIGKNDEGYVEELLYEMAGELLRYYDEGAIYVPSNHMSDIALKVCNV